MADDLRQLYRWVRGARDTLLAYLESLPADAYTRGLGGPRRDLPLDDYRDVASVRAAFAEVDALVERFLAHFADRLDEALHRAPPWRAQGLTVTPRWLLLHPITHEFHHKGQLVVIGRQLGFPPPETDLAFPG